MTMRSKLIFVLATFFALTCQPMLSSLDIVNSPLTELNEQNTNGRASGDWEWSTDFGQSSGNDGAWGITVNSDNESFITGHFRETVSFGSCSTCTHTSQGDSDIYIAKLDDQGDVEWVNTAGGSGRDSPIGRITQLDNGNFAIAGYVGGGATSQFDGLTVSPTGNLGLLIAVFDSTGNWLWANEYSGPHSASEARAFDITSDASSIYVTGDFKRSVTVDGVTYDAYAGNSITASMRDLIVMKVDYSGNYLWSQFSQGGHQHDGGRAIALDAASNVYIGGLHSNNAPFGNTVLQNYNCPVGNGYNPSEGLIAKLDFNGNWEWAFSNYGCHIDTTTGIDVTPQGDIAATTFVTADISVTDITGNTYVHSSNPANHQVLTTLYKDTGALIWYDIAKGHDNFASHLTVAPSGEIFVCGYGMNTGGLGSINTHQMFANQWSIAPLYGGDVWVAKYKPSGGLNWIVTSGADSGDSVLRDCTLNQNNVAHVAGKYAGDVVFSGPHPNSAGPSIGFSDAIVGKLFENYSSPNPNPCTQFNGMLGPVWDNSTVNNVAVGEVYEHPEGSGVFWSVIMAGATNADPGTNTDIWSEPCTCYEIWSSTPNAAVWNPLTNYNLHDIVEHPAGSYQLWYALDTSVNEVPDDPNNWRFWERCAGTECSQFNGTGGPIWDSTVSNVVSPGEIYEFPAHSGTYWMVNPIHTPGATNSDPGTNSDIWSVSCNCTDIWTFNGQPVWDASQVYSEYDFVESPAGSNKLWSPNVANIIGGASPEYSTEWDGCGIPLTPCERAALEDNNWPIWTVSGPPYEIGDLVSYGNEFYISIIEANNEEPGPTGVSALAWIECTCDEIKSELPEYNASNTYSQHDGVVYNNEVYWALSSVPANANPGPNQFWRTCNWCDSAINNIGDEWDMNVAISGAYNIGDVVSYNGVYWVSLMNLNPTYPPGGFVTPWPPDIWETPDDIPMWDIGWVKCSCSELAEPYDPSTVYQEGDVVLGPDGNVWISDYPNNAVWPSIQVNLPWMTYNIPTWTMCTHSSCIDPSPWNPLTASYGAYFPGDVVSHVGNTWVLMQGHSGTTVAPSTAMAANPGPWMPCLYFANPPVAMHTISNGQVDISTKTVQNISSNALSQTGEFALEGNANSDRVNSAIRVNEDITLMEKSDLDSLVSSGTIPVDVCDSKYGLNGYREENYLCGYWYEESESTSNQTNSSRLFLGPSLLCPDGLAGCFDVIIQIVEPVEEESSQSSNTSEDNMPGFQIELTIISVILAMWSFRRRRS